MSDDDNKDVEQNSGDDELDPQKLADEVAENSGDEALADEWAAAMEESGDGDSSSEDDWAAAMAEAGEGGSDDDGVSPMPLDELKDESKPRVANGDSPELDVILDIPVRISMEVGATQIPIRNLLQLNQGSVVELDRLAGEPLDVLVNGTLIAHGEVVMVNDKFGIRLTDVVSQSERIHRLR